MAFRIILLAFLILSADVSAQTGDPQKGEEIFKNKGCPICHSIKGAGGAVGPDLTQVTIRRTDERLAVWLKDPPSILKDTDMPKVPWKSDQEVFDLIAFFKTFRKEVDRSFMGKASKKEAGRRLIEAYDCKACHRIKDPASGRARFQDLTRIGRKRDKRWLIVWLKGADKVKPGTFMPDFPFTDDEVEAVAEYLSGLK